jgi:acetyltransferase
LGLDVVRLEEATVSALRSFLPPEAATGNPVDMIASASADHYRKALHLLFADKNVDAIICVFVPPIMIDEMAVAEAIVGASEHEQKPILSCFMGPDERSAGIERLKKAGIPVYTFPEAIARTYSQMVKYMGWRNRPVGTVPPRPASVTRARKSIEELAQSGQKLLLGNDALEVLDRCGIPCATLTVAEDVDAAVAAAAKVGYPVVLKLDAPKLVHKTDIGGVITDVRSEEELREKHASLVGKAAEQKVTEARVAVQAMVSGGVEMVLGMVRDPKFGPMIMCGFGGIFVEVVKDVTFKLPPLTREDAREMIDLLKGKRVLEGFRGAPAADTAPIVDALLVLSHLVEGFPSIQELDINPFVLCPDRHRSKAIDARIVLSTDSAE